MGFIEGRNVAIYHNPADLGPDRLPNFAADLVRRRVSVIFTGSNVGALAAKAATSDIPIVFVVGLDPVALGLVSSINRPGGNATGVAFSVSALEPKRFELLRNLMPKLSSVGVLVNPDNPNADVPESNPPDHTRSRPARLGYGGREPVPPDQAVESGRFSRAIRIPSLTADVRSVAQGRK